VLFLRAADYERLWVAVNACTRSSRRRPTAASYHLRAASPRGFAHAWEYIRRIGYHCRDYFSSSGTNSNTSPGDTLAHSTHVHGIGTYDDKTGVETPRIRVTLATATETQCREINLGYRDLRTIRSKTLRIGSEGVLLVPKQATTLYHLRQKPAWPAGPPRPSHGGPLG